MRENKTKIQVTVHAFYPPVANFLSPFQGLKYLFASLPRALPWVDLFCPFRANKKKNPPISHRGLIRTCEQLQTQYLSRFLVYVIIFVCSLSGCRHVPISSKKVVATQPESGFLPTKVILQASFTHIVPKQTKTNQAGQIETYVRLTDQFGDPLKALGQFSFELFEYRPAASDPRGRRFSINGVQKFDLTEIDANQRHWDSITGNYRFTLKLPDVPNGPPKTVVMQVTFSTDSGLRLEGILIVAQRK